MCWVQQGDELADQVLRYRSQTRPTRKPRSAGRCPAVPSPHQPCLDSPGDQVVHPAQAIQMLAAQVLAHVSSPAAHHQCLSNCAGKYLFCRLRELLLEGRVPMHCRGVARQAVVARGVRTERAHLALPRQKALRRARPSRRPSAPLRSGHLSCQPGAPRAASSPPSAPSKPQRMLSSRTTLQVCLHAL